MRDSDLLRAAAETIMQSSDAWALVSEFYKDRDLDADADDVVRALAEAADRLDGHQ